MKILIHSAFTCAGACRHALGHTLEAVGDYERTFSLSAPDAGEEARARQFLAFYQREMALHAAQRAHTPAAHYCLDRDLHPMFKARAWSPPLPMHTVPPACMGNGAGQALW